MTAATIAIIGAGNMGTCLLGGLVKSGHPKEKLWITNRSAEKLTLIQNTFSSSIHISTLNTEAANVADVILLAVKPSVLPHVLHELKTIIQKRKPLIISIVAGAHTASIEKCLDAPVAIVRAMPNTPAILGCGATALFANAHATLAQNQLAESILRAVGTVVWVKEEKLMDAVTAVSGSGPAYFFLIMEAMQNAGIQLGLPDDIARLLTLETALGAARMALENDKTLNELRKQVTSPGGTTERALQVFEEEKIQDIFLKALQAANERAQELGQMIAKDMEP